MSMKSVIVARVRPKAAGFTLAELLVSIVVVVIITLIASQLMTTATAITRTGNKHFDTDTQARVVLDRMALDFAQMVKRTDVDYYVKQKIYKGHGNGHGCGQGRNNDLSSDQIAFYSQVPGYYPTGYTAGQQSPISLVAYRVNESNSGQDAARYGRLERMAKGLGWNAINSNPNQNAPSPIIFATGQIDSTCGGNSCPCNGTTGPWAGPWSGAICNTNNSRDDDYEVIGPNVFRFEYYYMLKNGRVTDWPWDRFDDTSGRQTITDPPSIGLSNIRSIAVSIAVIDPASRALIQQAAAANATYGDILDVAGELPDFKNSCGRGNSQRSIGSLESDWKSSIEQLAQTGQTDTGKLVPREAAKGIRVYDRYFDLKIW
jgi:prepilin-type N-terminal cleavage/methylation domain-containing protein